MAKLTPINDETPLYSSRIVRTYAEYITRRHPDADLDAILAAGRTSRAECEDPQRWYLQRELDALYEAMTAAIGDSEICRKVGRFGIRAAATGSLRQIALGLSNPEHFFMRMPQVMGMLARQADAVGHLTGPYQAEIVVTQKLGSKEGPYQCQNRLGSLEGVVMEFVARLPTLEHPECVHRGGAQCRYVVSWTTTSTYRWRQIRSALFLATVVAPLGFFLAPPLLAAAAATACLLSLALSDAALWRSQSHELNRLVESQGEHAREILDELGARAVQSRLLKEIAQAASGGVGVVEFSEEVIRVLKQSLYIEQAELLVDSATLLSAPSHSGEYLYRSSSDVFPASDVASRRPLWIVRALRDGTETLDQLDETTSRCCLPVVFGDVILGALTLVGPRDQCDENQRLLYRAIAAQIAVGVRNTDALASVAASETQYRHLVESAASVILRFEPSGLITFTNSFAAKLFMLPQRKAQHLMLGDVFPATPAATAAFETLIHRLTASDELVVLETHIDSALATPTPLAWTLKAKRGAGTELEQVLAIGTDIGELIEGFTEREILAQQLHQAQKMEAVGTLAGGIAHDFNNLLTGIITNTQLILEDTSIDDPNHEILKDVDTLARSAADLTKRLLGFARKGKYAIATVDVNELILSTLRLFGRTRKEVVIETQLEPRLWKIQGDRGQLEQTLVNLFVNSSQAMPSGGRLTVISENLSAHEGDHRVQLTVRDTGVGMPKEIQAHIFDPFFTTKDRDRGTGLGLASVYGIVKNHDGTIEVHSEVGKGCSMIIRLPADLEAISQQDAPSEALEGTTGTLLVVDDETFVRRAVARMLEKTGMRVLSAESGPEALSIYQTQGADIDVVLLDMIMPGMGGPEVFDALLALNPEVKVILWSGYALGEQAQALLSKGAKAFFTKPPDYQELIKTLHSLVDEKRQG